MKQPNTPLDIDKTRLTKQNICFLLGINDQTLEDWYQIKGCPAQQEGGIAFFNLPDVFKWRIDFEKKKNKADKSGLKDGEKSLEELKRLDLEESHRKKKLDNDEKEGVTISASEADKRFYELAKGVKQNMMNIPPAIAPVLVGLDKFEIETKLRKEFEKKLNEFADGVKE